MNPKEDLRQEILACGRDPSYFISKYVKIKHPVRGLIPFALFDYQQQLLEDYTNYRFNITLKARQLGISEVTAAFAVWMMLFQREKNILVMASKKDTAKNIIKKVSTAFKNLPPWLRLANVRVNNVFSVELDNGSQIKAVATSEDVGRSEALSLLIVDEAAWVPKLDDLWAGLIPTVTAGGRVIVMSTPNGVGNKFHQLYDESIKGLNEFKNHMLMWWVHPERVADLKDDPSVLGGKTSTWFRDEIKRSNMSSREVAQELCCNFNSSGDTVIPASTIDDLMSKTFDPIVKEHMDRNLHVFVRPQEGHRYLLVADVARGDGKDASACHVFDQAEMLQVAEYCGRIPVDEYAKLLVDLGRLYKGALLVVENVGVGLACVEHVKLLAYENVYFSRKNENKPGEAHNVSWMPYDQDLVPGFTTSAKTRPLLISKLEEYVRNHQITFCSKRIIEELKTFIWANGRGEAARGYTDDLVMAAAIAAWIRDTYLAPMNASRGQDEAMLRSISRSSTTHDQIPGAAKDPRFVERHLPVPLTTGGEYDPRAMRMRTVDGKQIDLSWLVGGMPRGGRNRGRF